MQTRQTVPDSLVRECQACGRPWVTKTTHRRYDCGSAVRGYGTMCWRDHERIKVHGAPVTRLHKATDVAAEVDWLVNTGSSRDQAVREVASQLDLQVCSVRLALRRARQYAARQQVAA